MSEKIIEITDLHKQFGDFDALRGVSFDVLRGDVFGFLGPNGAGKSTTIRCLLSLIKPTSGSVRLFGQDLATHRNQILSKVGSIIEKPDFYKYLSARRNLEIFGRLSGTTISRTKIDELIEFVGLKGRENHKVSGFSHGMKQRLGIAQTLLNDPELIVLDEPTTGLDPQGIIDLRNLILQLKTEYHKTIILSSHILSEIELIATRMVIINKGKSIIEGNVADLLNQQELLVAIETDNSSAAAHALQTHHPTVKVEILSATNIVVHTAREMIPQLNQALTAAGIGVFAIEAKRKLEDYFLKIINN